MVERIRGLVQQAGQAYQRYFVVYNVHRSGEKGEEFRKEDRDGYGINFFMRVLKPLDQNAVALKDGIDTLLGKAEAAVQEITAFQQQGPNEAYLLKAQSIRRQADALLLKSKGVLGSMTGDIEKMVTKGSGLFKDLEEVFKETNHEMKLVRAGTALQRLTGVREAVPRMEAYLKEMKILMKDVGKIPKNLTKDNQIKPELDGFVRAYKETTEYHSQWHKHAATAEKTYLEILNRVNK